MKKISWIAAVCLLLSRAAFAEPGLPEACNNFGLDLLRAQSGEMGNLFFSPYSLASALAMAAAGAKGKTLAEMRQTLHFTSFDPNSAFQTLQKSLGESGKDITLLSANRLWGQSGHAYHAEFQRLLEQDYGAKLESVDFAADPEKARGLINSWVEEKTAKRIQDLIPQGALTKATDLVLANAIYFKAAWLKAFAKAATKPAPFHLANGTEKQADFLSQKNHYAYGENENFQLLRLPYADGQLAMVILLPKKGKKLGALILSLKAEDLAAQEKKMASREVDARLPKFRLEYAHSYEKILASLGMVSAFQPNQADFSGMREVPPGDLLFISKVAHKAFIAVDEKGTEAAAATAVMMMGAAYALPTKPVEFTADRPFLFWIEHLPTGTMLFMGRLENP